MKDVLSLPVSASKVPKLSKQAFTVFASGSSVLAVGLKRCFAAPKLFILFALICFHNLTPSR